MSPALAEAVKQLEAFIHENGARLILRERLRQEMAAAEALTPWQDLPSYFAYEKVCDVQINKGLVIWGTAFSTEVAKEMVQLLRAGDQPGGQP